jgi:hypothetical protein
VTAQAAAAGEIADAVVAAFQVAPQTEPYRHFLLRDVLPPPVAARLRTLPAPGAPLGACGGRRETNNAFRVFFDAAQQAHDADCGALAQALQSPRVVAALAERNQARLDGTLLRIEYCRDADGFWLEPHTDIAAKRLTFLIYLNTPPPGEAWGTDIYSADGTLVGTAPSRANAGLAFVPANDTWHGFARRKITGVRCTLIVNYVTPDWRSVNELAFPTSPVSTG